MEEQNANTAVASIVITVLKNMRNTAQTITVEFDNQFNTLKGRKCKVLKRLKLNSCIVKFIDNGQIECISRNALRRADEKVPPLKV